MANVEKKLFGVQYHPEVVHTPWGVEIIRNFLYDYCGCSGQWTMENFIETETQRIRSASAKIEYSVRFPVASIRCGRCPDSSRGRFAVDLSFCQSRFPCARTKPIRFVRRLPSNTATSTLNMSMRAVASRLDARCDQARGKAR
jgi:hypothetical protein